MPQPCRAQQAQRNGVKKRCDKRNIVNICTNAIQKEDARRASSFYSFLFVAAYCSWLDVCILAFSHSFKNRTFLHNNSFIQIIIAYKRVFSQKSLLRAQGLQLAGYAFHGFFAADFAVVAVCHKLNVTVFELVELQDYKSYRVAD